MPTSNRAKVGSPKGNKKDDDTDGVIEARRGLMKVMMDHFSSTPLQEDESYDDQEAVLQDHQHQQQQRHQSLTQSEREYLNFLLQTGDTNSIQTASERLQDERLFPKHHHHPNSSDDDDDDDGVNDDDADEECNKEERRPRRRNSLIQQELFRLHETKDVPPSAVLQRMNSARALLLQDQNSILADDNTSSMTPSETASSAMDNSSLRLRSMSPTVMILPEMHAAADEEDAILKLRSSTPTVPEELVEERGEEEQHAAKDDDDEQKRNVILGEEEERGQTDAATESSKAAAATVPETVAVNETTALGENNNNNNNDWSDYDNNNDTWNPFKDISSWLDGGQGVEVTDSGVPIRPSPPGDEFTTARPFRILGTSADDVSCHPHVLSPPLMESLLAFVPDIQGEAADVVQSPSSQDTSADANNNNSMDGGEQYDATLQQPFSSSLNFWLKYSLVRDGASLWTLLRQVRASTHCFLAIETDQGHVFGAFTSQPWRLAKGWYGSKDTFLWKMRRPRIQAAGKSIVEQVCQESEIQVYPYRSGNAAVQFVSKKCLMLGQGEIIPSPTYHNDPNKSKTGRTGKHFGYALFLNSDLSRGTTSTSETFGNPCLTDSEQRGDRFNVANIEVWTLTPHGTVAEAEQSELSTLFLDGGRDGKRLNFMNILSGGPI